MVAYRGARRTRRFQTCWGWKLQLKLQDVEQTLVCAFWDDVDLENGIILHLADWGHANGTPEHDDIQRYRSVGGYYILIANPEVLEGKAVV